MALSTTADPILRLWDFVQEQSRTDPTWQPYVRESCVIQIPPDKHDLDRFEYSKRGCLPRNKDREELGRLFSNRGILLLPRRSIVQEQKGSQNVVRRFSVSGVENCRRDCYLALVSPPEIYLMVSVLRVIG